MKLLASLLMAASLAASVLSASAAEEKPAAGHGAAPAAAAAPAPAAAKPDLTAGEAKFTAMCVSCHGAGGNSGTPANPKLAQQHTDYIYKQLQEFKAGKRPNPIMMPMAAQLSDADMKNIAAYVGSQKAKAGFAKDKELVATGERIYRGGIADRQIAACAGCHSPNGAGIPAQYPRLSGQHADYTAAQLTGFRDGARKNSPQMAQIAAKLNDREIRAVADYIAGLR
ncbi:MAG: cytochrome c4 [Burkholderiales bacterium]|nr:cytochrome c4 [Burkholderiales bacterium]